MGCLNRSDGGHVGSDYDPVLGRRVAEADALCLPIRDPWSSTGGCLGQEAGALLKFEAGSKLEFARFQMPCCPRVRRISLKQEKHEVIQPPVESFLRVKSLFNTRVQNNRYKLKVALESVAGDSFLAWLRPRYPLPRGVGGQGSGMEVHSLSLKDPGILQRDGIQSASFFADPSFFVQVSVLENFFDFGLGGRPPNA